MGDLVLQTHYEPGRGTYLIVIRADREVLFSHELLCSMSAQLKLTHHFHYGALAGHRNGSCFHDALLHIDGRNRQLLYRIGDYENDCWKATLEHDTL